MIDQLQTSQTIPTAPARARRQPASLELLASCRVASPMGENRLDLGVDGTNGFAITGLEARAAVCMHVTPATGTWTYVQKAKATTSSAGRLRTG